MAYIPNPDRGFVDADLEFASAQSIPTDGAADISENDIDLQVANPRAGEGVAAQVRIEVTTAFVVASGTSSRLGIKLCSSATAANTVGAVTDHGGIGEMGYNDAAGTIQSFRIPMHPDVDYLRYLSIKLDPLDDDTLYTAGAIDAWLDFD